MHLDIIRVGDRVTRYRHALHLCRTFGYGSREARALNGLGDVAQAMESPCDARAYYRADALRTAVEADNTFERARAHDGIARTHRATQGPNLAHQHWKHALAAYTQLALPDTDSVRGALDEISGANSAA